MLPKAVANNHVNFLKAQQASASGLSIFDHKMSDEDEMDFLRQLTEDVI